MKKINLLFAALSLMVFTTSCDDYLDKLPDDRADLSTVEKIKSILVTAYPTHSTCVMLEMSSDNVMDNGKLYNCNSNQLELYRWEDVTTEGNDDPRNVWSDAYTAIGTANNALEAIAGIDNPSEANALKAEALLCRAYGMFTLANAFCMAWNPDKADEYLGLPYPKVAGESVDTRGTLRELYNNINEDIEAALPLLDDTYLSVPKYHFNSRAAYAFAARFNLFFMNYEKAVEYATKALGNNPANLMRNTAAYSSLAGAVDIGSAYIRSGENANFMFITAYSLAGRLARSTTYNRIGHGRDITTYETFWAAMPWGTGSTNNVLYESHLLYGSNQSVYYPKLIEQFEITDKVNNTGYAHIVDAVFTADETVLVRAEAYTMLKQYGQALADMNVWIGAHCSESAGTAVRPVLTEASVNEFMDNLPEVPAIVTDAKQMGVKKPLHPQGFTVESGTQLNMLYTIIQMRRLETWQQGARFVDIKRFGIEFSHNVDEEGVLAFKAGDLRGALQLPQDVIEAGLEPNPRSNDESTPETGGGETIIE